jgi:hypothetical protein
MQQNLKNWYGEKERPVGNLGGQLGMVKLIAAVIEDNCPILRYLSKSYICRLIWYGGSINHNIKS